VTDPAGESASHSLSSGLRFRDASGFVVLVLSIYALTGSRWNFGYEGSNLAQARALLDGTAHRDAAGVLLPYTQGGLLDVLAYIPAILVERLQLPGGLSPLVVAMVQPVLGTMLATASLWLGSELWRNRGAALMVGLATAFATMVWPQSKWGMELTQAILTVTGAAALVRFFRTHGRSRLAWIVGGASLGMIGLTKVTGIVHGAALGLLALGYFLWSGPGEYRSLASRIRAFVGQPSAWVGLGLLGAGILTTLASNQWRYGGWFVGGRYAASHAGSMLHIPGGWVGLLFSPNKSIILFNPPVLLGLVGGVLLCLKSRMALMALVCGAGVVGLHLMVSPWADETYGPRRFLWLLPLLVACIPATLHLEWCRRFCTILLFLGVAAQLLAVSFNFTNLPIAVGKSPHYHASNMVWNPQFQPQIFQWHLWKSRIQRAGGGDSIPYEICMDYFAWLPNGAEQIALREERLRAQGLPPLQVQQQKIQGNGAVLRVSFPVDGLDVPDSWVVQREPGVEGWALGRTLMAILFLGLAGWGVYLLQHPTSRQTSA
jgi:hypothetical protein